MLEAMVQTLNTIAWQYILLPCVLVGGIYLSVRSRGLQFTRFPRAMRHTFGRLRQHDTAQKGELSPRQALSTALAGSIGTGNIIGTGQAVALGGYGAVFWLWAAALLGMMIKYAEIALAIRYRQRDEAGDWVGGPMYYIVNGMGSRRKWLASTFCIFAVCASFGIGNLSQSHAICSAVQGVLDAYSPKTTLPPAVVGCVLAILVALVLFGGMKRLGQVTERIVPAMCGVYLAMCLCVIAANALQIPKVLGKIVVAAFAPQAVLGAASGIAMRQAVVWGLRRSAFSNEAGLGSAAIAHSAAQTKSPAEQGLCGIVEVFVDTVVICSVTALAILLSGVKIPFGSKTGVELPTAAFATVLGTKLSALLVAACLILFAFTTILGWSLYGARCVQFLLGTKAVPVYQLLFLAVTLLGTGLRADIVWELADTCNALMAIPNFTALFSLSGVVAQLSKDKS